MKNIYEPYDGDYPDWARKISKKLEDDVIENNIE